MVPIELFTCFIVLFLPIFRKKGPLFSRNRIENHREIPLIRVSSWQIKVNESFFGGSYLPVLQICSLWGQSSRLFLLCQDNLLVQIYSLAPWSSLNIKLWLFIVIWFICSPPSSRRWKSTLLFLIHLCLSWHAEFFGVKIFFLILVTLLSFIQWLTIFSISLRISCGIVYFIVWLILRFSLASLRLWILTISGWAIIVLSRWLFWNKNLFLSLGVRWSWRQHIFSMAKRRRIFYWIVTVCINNISLIWRILA